MPSDNDFTRILGWPGYRVYRHEINERAGTLRLDQLKWQRLQPFEELAVMLLKHLDGIVNYCRTKVRFGVVEAVNGWVTMVRSFVSALGGIESSASSTAVAASLSRHGQITPMIAAVCAVLASVASTLVNLPIIYRETRDATLIRSLLLVSLLITVVGLAALGALDLLHPGAGNN